MKTTTTFHETNLRGTTLREWLMLACLLTPFVYLTVIWPQLPDTIATHFDVESRPNGWMAKGNAALVMGSVQIGTYLLLRFLPRIDPKNRLQSANYQKLRLFITVGLAATTATVWYVASHPITSMPTFVMALAGLLIAGIGNYLTTVRPNWFVGIRTPWTLSSDTVWRKTHRLGGRLMVAGGLLGFLLALVVPSPYTATAFTAVILAASLIPVVYSYVYFRQEKAR